MAKIEAEQAAEEEKRLAGLRALMEEIQESEMYAAELKRKEQEELSIEEKSKLLVETIAAQRKMRADQEAARKRSRPPTMSQLRALIFLQ